LSLPSRPCHWHIPLIISLVHVPRGRVPEPLWCLICLMANLSRFTFNQLSHVLSSVLLLIRTPLVRLTRTSSRSERAPRSMLAPAVPVSFFGRYHRSPSRGPLRRLGTSPSGTQTACAFMNQPHTAGLSC
jgi:hypothetical protein